jgi:hypothetical protein
MNLKNAVAVCLISLFSATLVVLIARSLDSQAASQLEPRLASIVDELRAIRKQGGLATSPGPASNTETAVDGLVVYYFHGNTRCPTCEAIESQAKETVQTDFASQLTSGEITWKVLNYEQAAAKPLATKFEIQMPVVVLARMKAGQIQDWKRLDEVWALVGDKAAFATLIRKETQRMLAPEKQPAATPSADAPKIPAPHVEVPKIPIPSADVPDNKPGKTPPTIPIPE